MEFMKVELANDEFVSRLSRIACEIVKKYYDPLLGAEQNDYMIEKFQSVAAIRSQLSRGYRYYIAQDRFHAIGFLSFYPRGDHLYLSKFYLSEGERGKGYGRKMLDFCVQNAKDEGLGAIELNVNKNNASIAIYERFGFKRIRSEKNDIGHGYFMDDYVYRLEF